jgi:SWI/SNF-related matrix-associated actin-dependent regulator of chromatin subfamily A3
LLTFIGVPPFQSRSAFGQYIEQLIKDRKRDGIERLKRVVAATCIRRTKKEHAAVLNLTQKDVRVESIEMSPEDRTLYDFFKRCSYLTAGLDKSHKRKPATNILELISMLRHICNHGEELLPESALAAWRKREPTTLTSEMLESSMKRCVSCDREIEELDPLAGQTLEFPCKHLLCESCLARFRGSQPACSKCRTFTPLPDSQSFSSPTTRQSQGTKDQTSQSPKVNALLRNIAELQTNRTENGILPKWFEPFTSFCRLFSANLISVVFTYWTKMLDKVGSALRQRGTRFQRIDGRSSLLQRKTAMATFENDPDCNVMLASIGAAGEGYDCPNTS